jgi:diguanylate cyclase (GGDEF)-like protein/PAS domain S-box-containing protein
MLSTMTVSSPVAEGPLSPDELAFAMFDDMADAFIVVDESQRLVAVNSSACALFAYAKEDLLGRSLDVLLPEGIAERHFRHVEEFAVGTTDKREMSASRTLLGQRKDGREFPVEIAIGRTMVAGRPAFNATIRDVSESRKYEKLQAEHVEKLQLLFRHAADGVVVVDGQGMISFASPAADQILGLPTGGLIGMDSTDFYHPDDYRSVTTLIREASGKSVPSVRYEARILTADLRSIWVDATTTLRNHPLVGGFVSNFRDVTEQRMVQSQREAVAGFGLWALQGASEQELIRRAVELTAEFLETDSAAVYESMHDGSDEAVIRSAVGWLRDLIGARIPTPPDSPAMVTLIERRPHLVDDYAQEPSFPGKAELEEAGVKSSLGAPIQGDDAPWGFIGVTSERIGRFAERDVAFIQAMANVLAAAIKGGRAEADFAERALRDGLTGLPNRVLLKDRIEIALAATRHTPDLALSVLFVDLDNFKRVNDTLGHDVGDELIQEVAVRLRQIVRTEDTVARFGGDEFIVTYLEHLADDPGVLADRILVGMRAPFDIVGNEIFVTASIGIATSHRDGSSSATLLRDADAAMYQAKQRGRDRYALSGVDHHAPLVVRADLENELHHALEREQFHVHYQPVVDSDSGQLVGSEALLRWMCPTRGVVPPIDFIPIAEESGLIIDIGRWVLQAACAQLSEWQQTYGRPDLSVSVNLSPRQLDDTELIPCIQQALADNGLDSSALKVEITETMIVKDLERATSTLESIAALGVGLVIDDFGTGYSSLSYLKALPVSCIKVDRSFIIDVETNVADQAIVAAVAGLAHRLDLCAVAEGVETQGQLATVRSLGCRLIQGYFYSPALPVTDFQANWLEAN